MTTWLMRNRSLLLAIVVGGIAAAAGAAVSSGAFAASRAAVHRHVVRSAAPRWPFSIFSHPAMARAHSADVGKVSAPQGAILASVSDMDGVTDELYAWHRTPQEDCLVAVEGGRELTVACSPISAAEAEGISWVGANSAATGTPGGVGVVVALVPDGVSKVEVTGVDGSTTDVEVANNVAATTEAGVKEFRYTMPDGKVVSHKDESMRVESH
jgi:hypothetical protein